MSLLNIAIPLVSGYFRGKLAKKKEENQLEKQLESYERKMQVADKFENKSLERKKALEESLKKDTLTDFYGPDATLMINEFGLPTALDILGQTRKRIADGYVDAETARKFDYYYSDHYKNYGSSVSSVLNEKALEIYNYQINKQNKGVINLDDDEQYQKKLSEYEALKDITNNGKDPTGANIYNSPQGQEAVDKSITNSLALDMRTSLLISEKQFNENLNSFIIKFDKEARQQENLFNKIRLDARDNFNEIAKQTKEDFNFIETQKEALEMAISQNINDLDNILNGDGTGDGTGGGTDAVDTDVNSIINLLLTAKSKQDREQIYLQDPVKKFLEKYKLNLKDFRKVDFTDTNAIEKLKNSLRGS